MRHAAKETYCTKRHGGRGLSGAEANTPKASRIFQDEEGMQPRGSADLNLSPPLDHSFGREQDVIERY